MVLYKILPVIKKAAGVMWNLPLFLIITGVLLKFSGMAHASVLADKVLTIIMYALLIGIALFEIITYIKAFLEDDDRLWRLIATIRLVLMMTVCLLFWYIDSRILI